LSQSIQASREDQHPWVKIQRGNTSREPLLVPFARHPIRQQIYIIDQTN
jgi:hypothetical protein